MSVALTGMSDGNHTCGHCGRQWFDTTLRSVSPMFCTPECADSWYDAHPEAKARAGWITCKDAADRLLIRRGCTPMPRATPARGDN